jgi:hypothetical protein
MNLYLDEFETKQKNSKKNYNNKLHRNKNRAAEKPVGRTVDGLLTYLSHPDKQDT